MGDAEIGQGKNAAGTRSNVLKGSSGKCIRTAMSLSFAACGKQGTIVFTSSLESLVSVPLPGSLQHAEIRAKPLTGTMRIERVDWGCRYLAHRAEGLRYADRIQSGGIAERQTRQPVRTGVGTLGPALLADDLSAQIGGRGSEHHAVRGGSSVPGRGGQCRKPGCSPSSGSRCEGHDRGKCDKVRQRAGRAHPQQLPHSGVRSGAGAFPGRAPISAAIRSKPRRNVHRGLQPADTVATEHRR